MTVDEAAVYIRNNVDIVEVVSRYVSLKKVGRNYFGLCPFHSEKTPSFSVNPGKGIFKCFGCGEGGDVIKFLSKIENVSYRHAIFLHTVPIFAPCRYSQTAHRLQTPCPASGLLFQRQVCPHHFPV